MTTIESVDTKHFYEIGIGDFFLFDGNLYIKTFDIHYGGMRQYICASSRDYVNSVNLQSGKYDVFGTGDEVIPVEVEAVIKRRINEDA